MIKPTRKVIRHQLRIQVAQSINCSGNSTFSVHSNVPKPSHAVRHLERTTSKEPSFLVWKLYISYLNVLHLILSGFPLFELQIPFTTLTRSVNSSLYRKFTLRSHKTSNSNTILTRIRFFSLLVSMWTTLPSYDKSKKHRHYLKVIASKISAQGEPAVYFLVKKDLPFWLLNSRCFRVAQVLASQQSLLLTKQFFLCLAQDLSHPLCDLPILHHHK